MKYNAGGNTPRTLDPTLTRKRGALSHPGTLLIGAVALIFFAYIFGYLPQLDTYYNSLVNSINGERSAAITIYQMAIPVGIAIVTLIVVAVVWIKIAEALQRGSKQRLVAGRPGVSEPEFLALAATYGVSAKVAQQTYKLLHTDYTKTMKVNLKDDLRRDLYWKDNHVMDVMGNLARHCDRKKNLKANPEAVRTVLDLLLYVESCPKQFITEQSIMRKRAGHPERHSSVRRAIHDGVTRMLKPLHKRDDVMKMMQTPAEQAAKAQPPAQAAPVPAPKMEEKKPALSFIRPRKYPPSIDGASK